MKKKVLEPAIETFLEGAGKVSAGLLGMVNKIGGQIYALLFLEDGAISLDEIAQRLNVSKSNVSINIRLLEEMQLVKKVWVKGSRKDYYVGERKYPGKVIRNFFDKVTKNISDALEVLENTKKAIKEVETSIPTEEKQHAEFVQNQLLLFELFYSAAGKYLNDLVSGKDIDIKLIQRVIQNPEEFQK